MTMEERIRGLTELSFTPSEAAFLARALLVSGCFLRRQHWEFLRIAKGARTTELVSRLTALGFARRAVCWRRNHLLHLRAPSLYAAIGEPNSRLRRLADPATVVQRLMLLDVVIAHRHDAFLFTEAEKVAFFTCSIGAPLDELPGTIPKATSPNDSQTTRYFIDRVPVQPSAGDDPVTFLFVPGWSSKQGFAAFLETYDPLFRRLKRCRIRFCTSNEGLAREARVLCSQAGESRSARRSRELNPVERRDALVHFAARLRFEQQAFHTFSQQELDRLREDLARFRGPLWDGLYERWRSEGPQALSPEAPRAPPYAVEFIHEPLTHEYRLFSAAASSLWRGGGSRRAGP